MIKILSIDGGGIKGIIPAMILSEIESRTKKMTSQLFDLVAGSSSGAVTALSLTKPNPSGKQEYQAQDIVRLFEEEGKHIFYHKSSRNVTNFGGFFVAKYPSSNLDRVFHKYFKDSFLSETLTDVLINTYEIERRDAFFFKSSQAKKDKKRNFLMKDVAKAAVSAPTYFPPEKIPTEDQSEYYALIDGGVYANNPAMCAFAEAIQLHPEEKHFLIVSLGTGELTRPIPLKQAKNWGFIHWSRPILNIAYDGVNDAVDYQLRSLLPDVEGKKKYYRFQVRTDDANDDFDNIDPENIRALKLYAERLIRDQSEEIDTLCAVLSKAD